MSGDFFEWFETSLALVDTWLDLVQAGGVNPSWDHHPTENGHSDCRKTDGKMGR